jgi:hypothetical protein
MRSLSQSQRGRWFNAFLHRHTQRMSEALLAKLKTLPEKDEKPDFSSISDPAALANHWAEEAKVTDEEVLRELESELDDDS